MRKELKDGCRAVYKGVHEVDVVHVSTNGLVAAVVYVSNGDLVTVNTRDLQVI